MINRITDNQFKLVSKYQPSGDQPQAIEQLVDNTRVEKSSDSDGSDRNREDLYHESSHFQSQ